MKTLILVRHAKSSWKDRSLPDALRPLSKRGRRDASMMGRRLQERGCDVELLVTSPAARAAETAEALAEEISYPWDEIATDQRLYEADSDEILEVIEDQDDWIDRLMLVGHNPGLTAVVNRLWSRGIDNVPTCGLVESTYDMGSWGEIAEAEPLGAVFDYPKRTQT